MSEPTEREWLEGLRPEDEEEFYLRGEHPEFSPEELAEIRRLAANEWSKVHYDKNRTALRGDRDKLTEQLQRLERIEEKTR